LELPDVNVLVALSDPAHIHYGTARAWFAIARNSGWATCPLTENGLLRILANPNYPNISLNIAEVGELLRTLRANHAHSYEFWADEISLCDTSLFDLNAVQGYRQLTDLYLLGLCQRHNATLVSFDGGLQQLTRAVVAARADLFRLLIP
jgi:uncharacterized protein